MIDVTHSVLLLVDIQPDFLPGGALGVDDGDAILEPVRTLMQGERFPLLIATQDWHPPGHISFASRHAGRKPFDSIDLYGHPQTLWPDHCLQGSDKARLEPSLPWDRVSAIIRKGMAPDVDSYSGFRNNWNPDGERPATGLAGYLRERQVQRVFICGLARDVCAKWTAEDAADAGFETFFLWDLTRSVDPSNDDAVRQDLQRRGVQIIERQALVTAS